MRILQNKNSLLSGLKLISLLCLFSFSNLAMAYNFSSNVLKFQKKLAARGDPLAQYKIGIMYETGFGIKKDLNQALQWYAQSSAQNNEAATRRIVYVDILQHGYQQRQHKQWFNKLKQDAGLKDGEALLLLGTIYKNGTVDGVNLKKAHKVLKQAVIKDVVGAEDEFDAVRRLLDQEKETQLAVEKKRIDELEAAQEKIRKDKIAVEKRQHQQKLIRLEEQRKQKLLAQQTNNSKTKVKSKVIKKTKINSKKQIKEKPVKEKPVKEKRELSWAEAMALKDKSESN